MSLLLRVTDNVDGTGATAVVTGGSGSLWVERATVTASAIGAYAQVGATLTNSGTVTPTGVGYYSWRVANAGGALTPYGGLQTTLQGGSIWDRCSTMIQDRITSFALPGSPEVLDELWADAQGRKFGYYACVTQTNQTPRIGFDDGFEEDKAEWPILVQLVERSTTELASAKARFLHGVERICTGIQNQKWDQRVPELIHCRVEPRETIREDGTAKEKMRFSQFIVTCFCTFNRFDGLAVGGA